MIGQGAQARGPSAADMEAVARAAMARLPDQFRRHLGDIVLRVEEVADAQTLAALGIDDPLRLSGLYHGRPLGEKSSMDTAAMPDEIHLYRRSILAEWRALQLTLTLWGSTGFIPTSTNSGWSGAATTLLHIACCGTCSKTSARLAA